MTLFNRPPLPHFQSLTISQNKTPGGLLQKWGINFSNEPPSDLSLTFIEGFSDLTSVHYKSRCVHNPQRTIYLFRGEQVLRENLKGIAGNLEDTYGHRWRPPQVKSTPDTFHKSQLSITWIPWNLSFRYIHCTGQFTSKTKANAEPHLLSSLVWIDSGVVVSQHRLESFFHEIKCNGMTSFMEFMIETSFLTNVEGMSS